MSCQPSCACTVLHPFTNSHTLWICTIYKSGRGYVLAMCQIWSCLWFIFLSAERSQTLSYNSHQMNPDWSQMQHFGAILAISMALLTQLAELSENSTGQIRLLCLGSRSRAMAVCSSGPVFPEFASIDKSSEALPLEITATTKIKYDRNCDDADF